MKTYDSFGSWLKAQTPAHRRVASQIRKLVHRTAPNLEETSKWGNACWLKNDLPLMFLHAGKDHLQFGFFAGAKLNDPKTLLKGTGKFVRHIRIEKPADIEQDAFATMIRRAMRAPPYK